MDTIDKASCPNCGAGLPLGRAGGSVSCEFCNTAFSYTATPAHPGKPAAIDQLQGMVGVPLHTERKVLLVGWQVERHQQLVQGRHEETVVTELEACDPDTGRSCWRVRSESTDRPLCAAFERVYYCTGQGELCAVDSATGNVAFVATLPAPVSVVGGQSGEPQMAVADPLGPGQPKAAVLVRCDNGQLVAIDRMSGQQVHSWPMVDPPQLWAVQSKHLLTGPVRPNLSSLTPEVWLLAPHQTDPVAAHRLQPKELCGGALAGAAVVQGSTGQHAAYQMADGQQAWQATAPWDPRTGHGAVFAKDLFVSDGRTLTVLPAGKSLAVDPPIAELRVVAGTAITTTTEAITGYTRTLKPRWTLSLEEMDWARLADNGRMLVCATQRDQQLWLRGVLPPNGRTRWSVLVPEAGEFQGLQLADDLVLLTAGGRRFVVRADSGQIVWTTGGG